MFKVHSRVKKNFDGVVQDIISTSATKLYLPPQTFVALNVDHDTACTWNLTSTKYPELIDGCVGFIQWTEWLCWLFFDHGTILPVWMQGVVQPPWEPILEIQTPPKKGCAWLSYVWLCWNYDKIMEDSHSMCVDAWNCAFTRSAQSSYWWPQFGHHFRGGRSWIWWAWCPVVTRGSTIMCLGTSCPDLRWWSMLSENVPTLVRRRAWQWNLLWFSSCKWPKLPSWKINQ